ncbi:MAG: hypothetical protein GQ565_10430 [Candidatus Aegiribacteria sp.]|nr:hypothetical protein [Candidatus Aegiribacteria sp.]
MKREQVLRYSIYSGWFITALVILLIAHLFVPEESQSNYFWYRIIWAEVLCLFFWVSVFFYTQVSGNQSDSVTHFSAIAPTMSIIICTYSILSILVMVIHAYFSVSDVVNRIHWILQITLFVVTALSIVFLSISRSVATSSLGFNRLKAETPKELHDLLAVQESSLDGPSSHELRVSIKQLREMLVFSLYESGSLTELPEYQELNREILSLCKSIAGLHSICKGQAHRFNSLNETTIALITKAKHVSVKQVRR